MCSNSGEITNIQSSISLIIWLEIIWILHVANWLYFNEVFFPAVGKLAPIFAKKKTGDEKESANQPKEDPEVARRRREFLLSGVPSELKRQAVCPVETVEGSDYAPFPDHSHVQQQDSAEPGGVSVWTLAAPDLEARLKKEEESEEFGMEELRWSSLQWPSVVPKENLLTSLSLVCSWPVFFLHSFFVCWSKEHVKHTKEFVVEHSQTNGLLCSLLYVMVAGLACCLIILLLQNQVCASELPMGHILKFRYTVVTSHVN